MQPYHRAIYWRTITIEPFSYKATMWMDIIVTCYNFVEYLQPNNFKQWYDDFINITLWNNSIAINIILGYFDILWRRLHWSIIKKLLYICFETCYWMALQKTMKLPNCILFNVGNKYWCTITFMAFGALWRNIFKPSFTIFVIENIYILQHK